MVKTKQPPDDGSQQNQNTAETQEMSPLKTEDQDKTQSDSLVSQTWSTMREKDYFRFIPHILRYYGTVVSKTALKQYEFLDKY